MKRRLPIGNLGAEIVPQLTDIWTLIANLGYEDTPDYARIHGLLANAMEEKNVQPSDEWDWHPQILYMGGEEQGYEEQRPTASTMTSEATMPDDGGDGVRRPLLRGDGKKCCCNVH
jgi:hypothetical protein